MRILSLILLSTVVAHGAEKPVCDANAVTRNCEFFEERKDQAKIKLADGSYIINPMNLAQGYDSKNNPYAQYEPASGGGGGGFGGAGFIQLTMEEQEAAQINQAGIIDQLAKTPVSTRFKMNFAANAGLYAANPDVAILTLWPPNSKEAKVAPIKGSVLFDYLKSKMKAADYEQMMKLIDAQKEKQVEMALALQGQQKAQLAQMQKQQEEALAENQRLEKRKKRIPELFKYAQEQMIALLRQGRKDADLTPEILKQIEKIKTVKLHDVNDPQMQSSSTCLAGQQQNAFYMPGDHEVNICPGFFNKSDAELVSIMAHEMGHSIDGCNSQFPLVSVNKEKIAELQNSAELTDAEKTSLGYLKSYGIN